MDSATPKRVAREAEQSTPLRGLARGGYAANGLVHILIGVIALVVAFGGDGATDQSGALMVIAAAPLGFVALWSIAIALCALGVWQLLEGVLANAGTEGAQGVAKMWGQRIGAWGQAAIFIALGVIAGSVALGAQIDTEQAVETASRGLLQIPGGPIVLVLIGVGIVIGGIVFIVMGAKRSFRSKIAIPKQGFGRNLAGLGVVGFIAKGIALLIVGVLLVVSSVSGDADTAGGLDGALKVLLGLALGPVLVATVGIGFVAYGVFCLFRARYAKLTEA